MRSRVVIGTSRAERIPRSRTISIVLLAAAGPTQHVVRDLGVELRQPGLHHPVGPGRFRIGRVAAAELQRPLALLGVRMGEYNALEPAALAHHVDRAPVRHLGDGQARHLREHLLRPEPFAQHLAGPGEEALSELGALVLGYVLDHVDGHRHVATAVAHRRRLDVRPALLAGRTHSKADYRLGALLALERASAGQVVHDEGVALGVKHVETVEDACRRSLEQGFDRVEAERLDGGIVHEQQAAIGRLDGHRVGDAAQHRLELVARLLDPALALAHCGSGPDTLEELPDLGAQGRGQRHERGIERTVLTGEELHHRDGRVRADHREGHATAQAGGGRGLTPPEAAVAGQVRHPSRLTRLPDLARQAAPVHDLELPAGLREAPGPLIFVGPRGREREAAVRVEFVEVTGLPFEGSRDGLEQCRSGLGGGVRLGQHAGNAVLDRQACGIALPACAQARDQDGQHPAHSHCQHPRHVGGFEEGVADQAQRNRDDQRQRGDDDGLEHGGPCGGDKRAGQQQLDKHRPRADQGVEGGHDYQDCQGEEERALLAAEPPQLWSRAQPGARILR